ncbi:MAG TPA: response regulator [Aquabacterium sp.]|nr:response regulator [Aquabacterium sp.]
MSKGAAGVHRIVLIDDNEPDNIFHEMVLRAAGFQGDIQVFDLPLEGLRYVQTQPDGPIDLVFLDINMPATDGWAVLAALKPDLPRWPGLRICMLTSSANPDDRAQAERTPGVTGFLTKPLEPDVVRQLLAT